MLKYHSVTYYLGLMLGGGCLLSVMMGVKFYLLDLVVFVEWNLFSFFSASVVMVLLFDWMSLVFIGFVMFISSMVLMYSYYYMEGDKYLYRFIILVYLFVLSMLMMVLSPNMISILLGWDGLGLVSYCLVIYYQGVKSANAGMLTILSNRVGDVAILLSIAWLLNYGSWSFYYVQYMGATGALWFVLIMVILASMTKSAQIPFSAWLPAAMAAPTPVSALVHSSTLVTAGVYLMIRFNYVLGTNLMLFYLGSVTMFMAGLGANYEMDLKKIIALSTLSQLGVMMLILSLGYSELAFFHLLTHALFKSLLFLCAGVFIHGAQDCQDIRFLGGTLSTMPVSSVFFICCSLSLCGFPFLSGFYSKDLILEVYMMGAINLMMLLIILGGTFFTVTYSVRLGVFLFFKNLGLKSFVHFGESMGMLAPMLGLFTVSVVAGSAMAWGYTPAYSIMLPLVWKVLILFMVIFLIIKIGKLLVENITLSNVNKLSVSYFFGGMWFMPILSTGLLMGGLHAGSGLLKHLDQGWAEELGGQGAIKYWNQGSVQLDHGLLFNLKMYVFSFFLIIGFVAYFL